MKQSQVIPDKIFTFQQMKHQLVRWDLINKHTVFTNGVFDILHEGHIFSLSQAASFSDILIVGVNSDASVKRLKGDSRPVNNQYSRALLLASLIMVDAVVIFEDDTPLELIELIKPTVLVKGGDYSLDTIVGAKEVIAAGGEVKIVPIIEGYSTTSLIEKMKNL